MNRFFTSDHHFGHANVIKYCNRPFSSVEEMNEEMVHRWNEVVADDDEVYYLGDFSMNVRNMVAYAPRLRGKKILIAGNHDAVHHSHKKWRKSIGVYEEAGFTLAPNMVQSIHLFFDKTFCLMSHMPYDMHDERYAEWHPQNRGEFLLHGHVHDVWKMKGRQLNVGVDVWDFYPVSEEQVWEMIDDFRHYS